MTDQLLVKKRNGRLEELHIDKINACAERACEGLDNVFTSQVVLDAHVQLYNKIPTKDIDQALILSARALIEKEPNYTYVAAKLLLNTIYKEVFGEGVDSDAFEMQYRKSFITNLKKLVKDDQVSEELLSFDLKYLSEQLKIERDKKFKYLGMQTLYDRYFLRINDIRYEAPQSFWMRIAMGLAAKEEDKNKKTIEFYNVLSNFKYIPSTPTLFNSGTTRSQLSSCYLSSVHDSIDGIFGTIHAQARLSKHAGGIGIDWSYVRANGAFIKGTNGKSSGIIPWLKILNDTLLGVDQSGLRKGAGCAYLEPWHLDFEDFIELRKITGDERRRCHDLHLAAWIPDLFMRRVEEDGDWYFFCPSDVGDLHDLFGEKFDRKYLQYCKKADQGLIDRFKKIKAKDLWKKMLTSLFETGHPWVTFKDASNIRYSNQHVGVVHSSNLCCMAGDQRVVTDKGILTVKELYDLGGKNQVVGREKIENASEMLLPRPDADMVKITTLEGYSHKVTPDHKVWIKDIGWGEAQNLKKNDKILIQQYEGMWGKENHENLAFLCGLIIGDGTFGKNRACIDLWDVNYVFLQYIQEIIYSVFEQYKIIWVQRTNACLFPEFCQCTTLDNSIKYRLSSGILRQILSHFGVQKGNKHIIPDFIWKSDKKTVAKFLEGLYYADAHIECNDKDKKTVISLSSINKKLLEDIQILLANFGIKTSIYRSQDAGISLLPDGKGGYKNYPTKALHRIETTSIIASRKLHDITKIGLYKNHEQFLDNINNKDGYQQKLYCTFDKLEKLHKQDAYCLSVDSDEHSWTVNGIITKNTEILLHSKPTLYDGQQIKEVGETAVCNLGSLNLKEHLFKKNNKLQVNFDELKKTIQIAIRMLDNVIDINFYPTLEAEKSNIKHRPIGLGLMGFHDCLRSQNIDYDSKDAISFADSLQEFISYHAIMTSSKLSKERGHYSTYEGSLWQLNKLPIDTYHDLMEYRKKPCKTKIVLDWKPIREHIEKYGMRNSNVMAIAPTATISYIVGCSQSIEPDFSVLFVYSTISGDFTVINEFFVNDAKKLGIWCNELVEAIKSVDGDLSSLNLPDELKSKYKTAFQISQKRLIQVAAARQQWIDQGQSLNLYTDQSSMKYLHDLYMYIWKLGLKTAYYLRSKSASKVEKSTSGTYYPKPGESTKASTCSIDDESCESCQ